MSVARDLRAPEAAPSFGTFEDDPRLALRGLKIFEGLTDSERDRIAAAARVVRVEQDRILSRGEGETAAYCFILRGQVAFAEFAQGTVPAAPSAKRRTAPVMQVAERVVALFDVGEIFKNDHVGSARGEDGVKRDMALFTCVNVVLLEIPQRALDGILEDLPAIRERVDAKAEEAFYRQTLLKIDGRSELLDFYVKQGFEYAHAIKVIQTDKCIDCDECVKACEDRHGIARIERFGPRVGLMQFTLNCRSCTDARCIDVCNFDAIGYDERAAAPEVIVYDNCVGCTKCAKACPHEAIRMVDVREPEPIDLVSMVEAQKDRPATRVAKGEEKAPAKKKAKRIANKCDHCFGYEDMACISACPTGAIIQIDPRALFRRDGGLIERADKYFERAPFELGWSQTTRTQGVRAMHALFLFSAVFVVLAFWEYIARRIAPEATPYRLFVELVEGPASAASLALTLTPVSGFLRWMGYIGSAMMVLSALYTLRLHVPVIRRVGSARTWFDFHVVFGLAGPALSLLHTNFSIFDLAARPLVVSLWWAVFGIVVSGLLGRFFYTAIPRLEAAAERQRMELDRGIKGVADEWSQMTMSANVLAQFMKAQEKTGSDSAAALEQMGVGRALLELARMEWTRLGSAWALRRRTLRGMKNRKLRSAALSLVSQRAGVDRRLALYGLAKRLLAWWRGVHIAITLLMFVLLAAHVAISVYATGWGI